MSLPRLFLNIFVTVTISLAVSLAGTLFIFASCMTLLYMGPGNSFSAYITSMLHIYTPEARLLIGLGSPATGLLAATMGALGVYCWRKLKPNRPLHPLP